MRRLGAPTLAVLSKDAVTTRVPSGLNAALSTGPVCPESVASAAPVLASHKRAVPSSEAVTTRVPSGLNAAPSTASVCPESVVENGPGLGVPQARGVDRGMR